MKAINHKERVKELDDKIWCVEAYIECKESAVKSAYQQLRKSNPDAKFSDLFEIASKKVDYHQAEKYKKELEQLKKELDFHYLMGLEKKYMNKYLFTDVCPYEVTYEITHKMFMIRPMKCTIKKEALEKMRETFVLGGFLGHTDNSLQEWDIESDQNASEICVHLKKDGYWYETGSSIKFKLSDKPMKVYDYNF